MKLGEKFKEELKRPRQGWIFRTSSFILDDPNAFRLLFFWGLWFACINFVFWSVMFIVWGADIVLTVLFCFFSVVSINGLLKYYRNRVLWNSAFKDMSVSKFMRYKR